MKPEIVRSLRSSLVTKLNLMVALILLATMALFVAIDYFQERQALLKAKAEQLFAIAASARVSLEGVSSASLHERILSFASAHSAEAPVSIGIVENGSVAASSDPQLALDRLRSYDEFADFRVWLSPTALAVSVPLRSGSQSPTSMVLVQGSLAPMRSTLGRTLRMHVLHALATVAAMALGIAWVLERSVLSPLRRVLSAINVVERGTWEVDIPVRTGDEMGILASAFNRMGRHLTQTVAQLVQAEKLSALALLAIQVGRHITGPLHEIEEKVSHLGNNAPDGQRETQIRQILEASERARRAAQKVDEAFLEAFAAARSSSAGTRPALLRRTFDWADTASLKEMSRDRTNAKPS